MAKEKDDKKKRIFINHSEQNAAQEKEKSNA